MIYRGFIFFFSVALILSFSIFNNLTAQGVSDGTPDKLRRAYEKAFETMFKDPANLEKTFSFAGLAIKAGDFEGAISSLERMLILDPNLPRVRYELGVLYFKLGSYDVAATYFEELLEDGRHLGINLNFIVQQKPLGIANAIVLAEKFIEDRNIT